MPKQSDANLDLDEGTAFLARKCFAEARQIERDELAAETQRRSRRGGEAEGRFWDWLAGASDSDAGDD